MSNEDLDKANLSTRLVLVTSEMVNKPNLVWKNGIGRTDQRCVWSWWSASCSGFAQLSFMLNLQSLSLFCFLTAFVDEFMPGCTIFCKLFPCGGINAERLQGGLQSVLEVLPLASNWTYSFGELTIEQLHSGRQCKTQQCLLRLHWAFSNFQTSHNWCKFCISFFFSLFLFFF